MTQDPDVPAREDAKKEQVQEDEKQPESATEKEQLYDIIIPPGTPQTIIMDIVSKYEVELVERKQRLTFANMDGDERELLAFRGKLEVIQKVEKYFFQKMREFIGET